MGEVAVKEGSCSAVAETADTADHHMPAADKRVGHSWGGSFVQTRELEVEAAVGRGPADAAAAVHVAIVLQGKRLEELADPCTEQDSAVRSHQLQVEDRRSQNCTGECSHLGLGGDCRDLEWLRHRVEMAGLHTEAAAGTGSQRDQPEEAAAEAGSCSSTPYFQSLSSFAWTAGRAWTSGMAALGARYDLLEIQSVQKVEPGDAGDGLGRDDWTDLWSGL